MRACLKLARTVTKAEFPEFEYCNALRNFAVDHKNDSHDWASSSASFQHLAILFDLGPAALLTQLQTLPGCHSEVQGRPWQEFGSMATLSGCENMLELLPREPPPRSRFGDRSSALHHALYGGRTSGAGALGEHRLHCSDDEESVWVCLALGLTLNASDAKVISHAQAGM